MVHSFLNYFLPEDEYKRIRIVYFMAEAAFLLIGILLLFFFLNHYWLKWNLPDGSFVAFMVPMIMVVYTYTRYVFSGIEFTDIATRKDYRRQSRITLKRSLTLGLIYFVVSFIFKGIPSNWVEAIDIIGPAILVIVFYYIYDYISLKRSFKKNKELDD